MITIRLVNTYKKIKLNNFVLAMLKYFCACIKKGAISTKHLRTFRNKIESISRLRI